MADLDERLEKQLGYSIALQRAIEYHSDGEEVPSHIAEKCPHHAGKLNKSLLGHTKEESEMLNWKQRLDAWHKALEDTLCAHTESIGHLGTRLNAHAEDITDLARRVEVVYREHRNAIFLLKSDMHTLRTEHIEEMAKRIEQLGRLLEKGDTNKRLVSKMAGMLQMTGVAVHSDNAVLDWFGTAWRTYDKKAGRYIYTGNDLSAAVDAFIIASSRIVSDLSAYLGEEG